MDWLVIIKRYCVRRLPHITQRVDGFMTPGTWTRRLTYRGDGWRNTTATGRQIVSQECLEIPYDGPV